MTRTTMAAFILTGALLTGGMLGGGVVSAKGQTDPIAQREQIMKGVGAAFNRDVGRMVKGTDPFDLAKAKAAFATVIAAAGKMPALFPDNSKTGADTRALPAIWDNKADFTARWTKLGADASRLQPTFTDLASLKTAAAELGNNCTDCHAKYRTRED